MRMSGAANVGRGARRPGRWMIGGWMLLLAGALSLFQGCSIYRAMYGGPPPRREAQGNDKDLYQSAETSLQRRRYEDARKDLQRLMNQYPDSDLVAVARLASAKALYLEKKYDEARAEYQRFLELHPQHERADEAHYYLAMTYFQQAEGVDRDQTYTRKALDECELLLKQMPDSQYAPDCRVRSAGARLKLAEKEVYIGRFYFDRGNYAAAVGRLRSVLDQYPNAGFDDEALYFLGESLWRLEQKDEARVAFQRLVDDYSQSEWAAPAAARLGIALVRTGPPKPAGPSMFARMWQGLQLTWKEVVDTVHDYTFFQQ